MSELVKCRKCGYRYEIYPAIPATDDTCPNCGSNNYDIMREVQLRVSIDVETYKGLWKITKRKFRLPSKKLASTK